MFLRGYTVEYVFSIHQYRLVRHTYTRVCLCVPMYYTVLVKERRHISPRETGNLQGLSDEMVEKGLKLSVMINYMIASLIFFYFNWTPSKEKKKIPFQHLLFLWHKYNSFFGPTILRWDSPVFCCNIPYISHVRRTTLNCDTSLLFITYMFYLCLTIQRTSNICNMYIASFCGIHFLFLMNSLQNLLFVANICIWFVTSLIWHTEISFLVQYVYYLWQIYKQVIDQSCNVFVC